MIFLKNVFLPWVYPIPPNTDDSFVSDSPYLHAFDGLECVHHQMEGQELQNSMERIGYQLIQALEHPLPNGKKLVQLDFDKKVL